MPVDASIFNNVKTYQDYEAQELQKQLIQAQTKKAMIPDLDTLGQQAYLKMANGLPLSATENAALSYIDQKSQTYGFNPATGRLEQKPSLLQRIGGNQPQQMPAPKPSAPLSTDMAAAMDYLYNEQPTNQVDPWEQEYRTQLAAAAGNPKLEQDIKTAFAKSRLSMNESEAKNAGFSDRMLTSNPVIAETTPAATSVSEQYKSKIPLVGNFLVSDEYQKFDQAQRDFINAQLRRESGAVISPEEFSNAKKQYFPQPGDSAEVIAQKELNRINAVSAMKRSAGPAYKAQEYEKSKADFDARNMPRQEVAKEAQGIVPRPGSIVSGDDGDYMFNGGNPADPKSWKKVR